MLLRAGTAPRTLLLLNLLSALLSCLGAALGVAVGQSWSHFTPWILTTTAGIFLYVALADMVRGGAGERLRGWVPGAAPLSPPTEPPPALPQLPEALRGAEGPAGGSWRRFLLQNAGFLLGSGIMLGIALAEGHLRAWLQP